MEPNLNQSKCIGRRGEAGRTPRRWQNAHTPVTPPAFAHPARSKGNHGAQAPPSSASYLLVTTRAGVSGHFEPDILVNWIINCGEIFSKPGLMENFKFSLPRGALIGTKSFERN
jgi:hypothetical protein